jgi:hypothetical protein
MHHLEKLDVGVAIKTVKPAKKPKKTFEKFPELQPRCLFNNSPNIALIASIKNSNEFFLEI